MSLVRINSLELWKYILNISISSEICFDLAFKLIRNIQVQIEEEFQTEKEKDEDFCYYQGFDTYQRLTDLLNGLAENLFTVVNGMSFGQVLEKIMTSPDTDIRTLLAIAETKYLPHKFQEYLVNTKNYDIIWQLVQEGSTSLDTLYEAKKLLITGEVVGPDEHLIDYIDKRSENYCKYAGERPIRLGFVGVKMNWRFEEEQKRIKPATDEYLIPYFKESGIDIKEEKKNMMPSIKGNA